MIAVHVELAGADVRRHQRGPARNGDRRVASAFGDDGVVRRPLQLRQHERLLGAGGASPLPVETLCDHAVYSVRNAGSASAAPTCFTSSWPLLAIWTSGRSHVLTVSVPLCSCDVEPGVRANGDLLGGACARPQAQPARAGEQ